MEGSVERWVYKYSKLFTSYGLNESDFEQLAPNFTKVYLQPGGALFNRGDIADSFYLLVSGSVGVVECSSINDYPCSVYVLEAPTVLGDFTYFVPKPQRIHTLVAESNCFLLKLPYEVVDQLAKKKPKMYERIIDFLATDFVSNVDSGFKQSMQKSLQNLRFSHILINVILILILYLISFKYYTDHFSQMTLIQETEYQFATMGIFMLMIMYSLKHNGQTISKSGVSFIRFGSCLGPIVNTTLLLTSVVAISKYIFAPGEPLFSVLHFDVKWHYVIPFYLLFCFLQEFVARGGFLNFFEQIVSGRYRLIKAVLMSNLVFVGLQLNHGFDYAIMMFIPGLVWSWLYLKKRNVFACTLSHFISGIFIILIWGERVIPQDVLSKVIY